MKTKNLILILLSVFMSVALQNCTENNEPTVNSEDILPSKFSVNIPDAISRNNTKKLKSADADSLSGGEIYENLNTFIWIGEAAADITESIITAIKVYKINKPMTLSYEGDDDHRTKNLVVVENSAFEGTTWQYELTVTDAESEGNADGGKAMQVFWNNSPVKGIAILKPYNMNRLDTENGEDAIYRIDYSEAGEHGYEASMIVSIAGLPVDASADMYAISSLKMFVGKNGDIIDVYGNSNHPNAKFFTDDTGFDWAFVASGTESTDIGVAEVGLPPNTLDETSRVVLLEDYSVKNVFLDQITRWFIETYGIAPDSTSLAGYLHNADAPGFFDTEGFVQGGTSPGSEYDELVSSIQSLIPYNPKNINELEINFK
ncbi:MAG: hypothetical protein GXO79_06100 [Chlorobi bacterium]|nr:hypothetical protein [Chlorobiota bacterium]